MCIRDSKKVEGTRLKEYDPELEKVPHYMRERVAFLIDQCVNRRTKEFMDEFRRECYQEIEDQKRTNQEHIDYYTQNAEKKQSEVFNPSSVLKKRNPLYQSYTPYSPYPPFRELSKSPQRTQKLIDLDTPVQPVVKSKAPAYQPVQQYYPPAQRVVKSRPS